MASTRSSAPPGGRGPHPCSLSLNPFRNYQVRGQSQPTKIQKEGREYHTMSQDQLTFRYRPIRIPHAFHYYLKQLGNFPSIARHLGRAFGPSRNSWGRLVPSGRNIPTEASNGYAPQTC